MNENLEKSIIQTLAFFSIFNHPLTAEELFRFLWNSPNISYNKFLQELDTVKSLDDLSFGCKYSFYYLKNKEEDVEIRRNKTVDNDFKRNIALRASKKLRYVPFVKAVLLCNNSSFEMAGVSSDIDVAIIIKNGRLWLGRLLATILLSIFRLRRNKKKTTNRICLSFYTVDTNLDFSQLAITKPDIGLIYWIAQFSPLYDPDNLNNKILQANKWMKEYLPNIFDNNKLVGDGLIQDNKFSTIWKKFWETAWSKSYGNLLEDQAKSMQKLKMRRNLHSVQDEPDTRVVINDKMLKFHENDRREEYKRLWEQNCFLLSKRD